MKVLKEDGYSFVHFRNSVDRDAKQAFELFVWSIGQELKITIKKLGIIELFLLRSLT